MLKKIFLAMISLFLFVSCGSSATGGTTPITPPTNKYTITWQDYDGTVLEVDNEVEEGMMPTYDGETPERESDAQYTYIFIGWDPVVVPAKSDVTYTAKYSSSVNSYTVIWQNYDGRVLEVDTRVAYGTMPSYEGSTPYRASDEQYDYTFVGWSPEVERVKEDVTYTAVFEGDVRLYTVTWKNYDDSVLDTERYEYGETPEYKGSTPTKPTTDQYDYVFDGWDKEISKVTGDITYVATFTGNVRSYTVTWLNYDQKVLSEETYAYGETPTYKGNTPVKPSDKEYEYTFIGWTPEVSSVTGNATYVATYKQSYLGYTITWKNYDGEILEVDEHVQPGTIPTFDKGIPTREGDEQYKYTFAGWDHELLEAN